MNQTFSVYQQTLKQYFYQRITKVARQFKPKPAEDICWYIIQLLVNFGDSRRLFDYDEEGPKLKPLAFLYKEAHETKDAYTRNIMLRRLGDLALFLGSLFPEKYQRKGIGKDYFVGMGAAAYDYLSEVNSTQEKLYSELSVKFNCWINLIEQVCQREQHDKLWLHWHNLSDKIVEPNFDFVSGAKDSSICLN